MKERIIVTLLHVLTILPLITNGCTIGDSRTTSSTKVERYDEQSGTRVYLDLEPPLSCGGYLRNITLCYLNVVRGRKVTAGTLSLWEPLDSTNGVYRYEEVVESEVLLPLETKDSCGINETRTDLEGGAPNLAREIVCESYCFMNNITVKSGSAMGITYTDNINYARGQMLAEYNQQSYGVCVGNIQFDAGDVKDVSCPMIPTNITTTLLAQAGIDPIMCPQLSLQYGTLSSPSPHDYGSVVNITCQTGFQLVGSSSLTCTEEGQWSHSLPYCTVLNCTDPGIPTNGSRTGNDFNNGSMITFTCNSGYTLIGSEVVSCFRGNWSSPNPLCNTTTSNNNNNDSDTNAAQQYQFLTAILIVALFIIAVTVSCVAGLLFVYKRYFSKQSSSVHYDTNQPTTPTVSLNTFQKPLLLGENEPNIQSNNSVYDEIPYDSRSPYPAPPLSARSPIPPPLMSPPPHSMSPHSIPTSPSLPSLSKRGEYYNGMSPPFSEGGRGGEGGEAGYYTPSTIRSIPGLLFPHAQHYETSDAYGVGKLMDEDEEGPYWEPAVVEEKLYLQLDHIRVTKIPNDELEIIKELGSGHFSKVSKGIWHRPPPEGDIQVAVKVLVSQEENDKIKFLQEAALMGQFTHTNVLTLFGVVTCDLNTTMIVTELMEGGDLHDWLLKRKREVPLTIKPDILLNFCRQICLGMSYLSSRKFVHRDLAARNVLVTGDNICKISDFGMSHDLLDETYYMGSEGGLVPVKWTAPEALKYRKYSTASDVWSYGCVLYEIWSLGHKPFDNFKNNETIRKITSGCRLSPPPGCPRLIYEIMIKCWHPEPKRRPSFNEIMLLLLREDQKLLHIPEESTTTLPAHATQLGADLKAGEKLYQDLQSIYTTQRN